VTVKRKRYILLEACNLVGIRQCQRRPVAQTKDVGQWTSCGRSQSAVFIVSAGGRKS